MIVSLIAFISLHANYKEIEDVCQMFERDYTLVIIGAQKGSFAFEMAENDGQCKVIMFEDNNPRASSLADKLLQKCNDDKSGNTPMLLNKRLNKTNFKNMARTFYFDIVCYLDHTYYTTKKGSKTLSIEVDNMLSIGWHTFFQARAGSDLEKVLETKNAQEITLLENGDRLFYFLGDKKTLDQDHLHSKKSPRNIRVNFNESIVLVETKSKAKYKKLFRPNGLSLIDFKLLYGAYPKEFDLKKWTKKVRWNKKVIVYPEEIFVTSKSLEMMAQFEPKEGRKTLSSTLLNKIIETNTRYELDELIN